MTLVPAAWTQLPGSELVSSEDESWLHQSGFHLSDSSDDEDSNLLSQAYVKAVAQLKKDDVKRRAPSSRSSQQASLESPSKVPATCRLALPAAQIKTAAIKPDLPQAPSSSAPTASPQPSALRDQSKPPTESMSDRPYSPDASQEAELTQQPQQLGADLGPEASVPQDAQAISQQKAAAVGTAVPSLTTADHSSKSPSQKDSGQAVMFMFPQELAHPPASCDQALESQAVLLDATGATVSPVSPHRPAASQNGTGGLASPAGAASVQGFGSSTTEAVDAVPSEAGEALLAALSEEEIARIFENAQLLLEQRDASPRQSPLLQPADAPEAVHAGVSAPLIPPASTAVQQTPSAAAPAEADPTSLALPTATLSLDLSPPSKEALKLQNSPGATAEGWAAAGSPTVFSGAATVDEAAQAGPTASSTLQSAVLLSPVKLDPLSEGLVGVAAFGKTSDQAVPDSRSMGAQQPEQQQVATGQDSLAANTSEAQQAAQAKQAQQAPPAQSGSPSRPSLQQPVSAETPSQAAHVQPEAATTDTTVGASSPLPTAEALPSMPDIDRGCTHPSASDTHLHTQPLSPQDAPTAEPGPTASSSANVESPVKLMPHSAAPSATAAPDSASLDTAADLLTPAKPVPLVTALSADQLRAILSSAGLQPVTAGSQLPTATATAPSAVHAFTLPQAGAVPASASAQLNTAAAVTGAAATAAPPPLPGKSTATVAAAPNAAPAAVSTSAMLFTPAVRSTTGAAGYGSTAPKAMTASMAAVSVPSVAAPPAPALAASPASSALPLPPPPPVVHPPSSAAAATRPVEDARPPWLDIPFMAADPSLFSPLVKAAQKPASGTGTDPAQGKPKKKRKRDQQPPAAGDLAASQPESAAKAPSLPQAAPEETTGIAPSDKFNQQLRPSQRLSAYPASPAVSTSHPVFSGTPPLQPPPTYAEAKRARTHSSSASADLLIMQQVHAFSPVPAVGDRAVVAWLKTIKSLVHDPKQKFSLRNAVQAIGEFAIGNEHEAEIFLGDVHAHADKHAQISLLAGLFGVEAMQSKNPSSFHETYRLTRLVKLRYAGILDQDTDPVVYFVVKLARLCHEQGHNKHDMYRFRQELNATMALAKTMQNNFNSTPGRRGPLKHGAKQRVQQLLKLGYLAVKRPKAASPNPPLYPPWQGKPLYGPSSSTPQVQPLPARGAATVSSSSGAVPFVPGPAVAPVSLRPIQSSTSQAIASSLPPAADLSPASLPAAAAASLPGPSTAAPVSRPPHASAGYVPAQTAPLSIVPNPAPVPAGFPHALSHLASVRSSPFQPLPGLMTTTQALSGGHSQLPLLPPTVPSSSCATAPLGLPLPLDTTAALVAAVGPLFEAFVAQAAAVVDKPDMPMQALVGQVTQDLAAAIAAAAMQVVDARRRQAHAVTAAVGVAAAEPLKLITAEASQAPATVAESAKLVHAPKYAPLTYDGALAKAVDTSQAGHAASGAAHADPNFSAVSSPNLSVVSLPQEPSAASRSAPSKEAKQSGSKHFVEGHRSVERNTVVARKPIASQGKASQQAIVVEGKHRRDAGTRHDSNSPPSVSTLGLPAKEKKTKQPIKSSDTAHGQSKATSGVVGAKSGVKDATQHKQTDSKKRCSNDTPGSAGERAAKRPHMLSSTPGGSLEYEGYVVPGLDISRYEKGKDKAQVDRGSRPSSASHLQGVRDARPVRPGSPHSRSSKSSGRSSPKDFRPLSAASDSLNGSRRDSRSPREPSRLNVGSMVHDTTRHDAPAVPSRMAGRFGSASPVLSAVLPFEPSVDVPLCHGFGAPDFRPVGGRQHGRDGGWQHVEARHFDPLPLPDISGAPDFTPQFLPGGPAN